jgi:hypothetical protein
VAGDAGYNAQDKGADWGRKVLGWTAEIVRHRPKPLPEEEANEEMGEGGVDQRGHRNRPAEATRAEVPQVLLAEEVHSGEDILLVVGAEQRRL